MMQVQFVLFLSDMGSLDEVNTGTFPLQFIQYYIFQIYVYQIYE